MRLRSLAIAALLIGAMALLPTLAQPSDGGGARRFDGDWLVTMSCPSNTEKSAARGYKRQFPAQVKDSVLHGEIGVAESAGWLAIEGRIGADGNARLDARGRTGDPDYAAAHPPPSSPYAYHVEARFEAAHGSGRRLEQRVCTFAFERR